MTKHPYPLYPVPSKPAHGFLEARTSCFCRLLRVLSAWAVFVYLFLSLFFRFVFLRIHSLGALPLRTPCFKAGALVSESPKKQYMFFILPEPVRVQVRVH